MIVLGAILVLTALGAPAAWRLRMPGLAFLFGSGIVYLSMFVGFRLWLVLVEAGVLAVLLFAIVPRRADRPFTPHALDLASIGWLGAYALYATAAAPWHWDFWAIWGLKGRVFFEHGGIDFAFLRAHEWAHPDYPLLVPFDYTFVSLLGGEWNDRWLGLFTVAFAVSLWLVVRQLASRELPPIAASATGFAAASLACSQYVGLAEVPLIAFGTAGVLLARAGDVRTAAILLGFAASTKNEGLTLLLAAVLLRWRLWPAILIALPWLIVRAVAGLPTDLLAGAPLERIVRDWPWETLLATLDKRWCWLAILLSLPLTLRRERFLFSVVALQLAFFLAAYAITPNDLQWHIGSSWDRLSRQLIVPASYAALVALAARFARGGNDVAEARSEH